jgi:diguanylate cyclase (GGDEF)-like protein
MREILQCRVERGMYGGGNPEQYIQDRIHNAARGVSSDSVIELADGRTISVAHRPMPDGGWVATHEDITERREAEAQIAHMAHHDSLTDLPNRVLFRNRMHQALARVQRGDHAAVLCLDIDRFKSVNDTLGHPVGDKLLRAVAERLRGCIRETDTVARLGGDEFAILQVGADQPSGASGLARRIVDVISEPYDLGGHHVVVGTSIGIALAPTDATDVDELLKNADLALYRAKAEGRARYRFFEREMDARVQDRRLVEVDLRKALSAGEFELYYQPLMNLERNEVSGLEALIRWHHPERGMVSPADFIPLAEEIGLIVPIGEWVLREACSQAANWPTEIKLAVNLSPAQFRTRTLVSTVVRALAASGLAASRLELEITESVLLRDDEANLGTLHQLRGLGVRISLDDFGTGYSSLSYLRSFPFDKIKIDQSFVRELSSRSDCAAIVEAVATLGRTLGMATTAEGVETREQLEELRSKGCTEAQGYLFSRPRPAHELWELFPGAPLSSAVA